jgi:hypothetical protein
VEVYNISVKLDFKKQKAVIENMVDIKNLKNFIMQQFVDFKYRIW